MCIPTLTISHLLPSHEIACPTAAETNDVFTAAAGVGLARAAQTASE